MSTTQIPEYAEFQEQWEYTFWIPGEPAPGGSKKMVPNKRWRPGMPLHLMGFLVDDAKYNAKWKKIVAGYAKANWNTGPLDGPCEIHCMFLLARPQGHFGTGRNAGVLKDSAPKWHLIRPDASKLRRSTEDAMKGIVYNDDAQIVDGSQGKRYCAHGQTPGCIVTVRVL